MQCGGDTVENFGVIAYTDGACKGNPGIGGWGVMLVSKNGSSEFYGGEQVTTNNRMELIAAIKAVEKCPEHPSTVLIYTDSQYLMKGITEWIKGWKTNGWKNSKREPVKNIDLWKNLDELCGVHNITWRWVRGHNENPGNERADVLANKGIDKLRNGKK
jgi:ribonuclease HI